GTLSVARQIGLTISPTIFGTFIQRGFSNLGQIIPEKLQQHGVDSNEIPASELEKLSEQSYSDIQSSIEQIPSENVQTALQEAVTEADHKAYEPIYISAAIAAIVIIILSIIFNKKFKRDAWEEEKSEKEH